MLNIQQLNKKHAFEQDDQCLRIVEGNGEYGAEFPFVEIQNKFARATISLYGAHLLTWLPVNEQQSVIWLSDDAIFAPGKSIRGGIPVCWPWFGAHASHADYPAHGFARTSFWQLVSATPLATGETQIRFRLECHPQNEQLHINLNQAIKKVWFHPTVLEYCLTIGRSLTLSLTTTNYGKEAFILGQALHTYFAVSNIKDIKVDGLNGKTFLDKTDNFAQKKQDGPITFQGEVDRVYLATPDKVLIHDSGRNIEISKQGSHSTVVWNPGKEVADKMGDLGNGGYQKMVCVESSNAANDTVSILPGQSHTLRVQYDIVYTQAN